MIEQLRSDSIGTENGSRPFADDGFGLIDPNAPADLSHFRSRRL